MNILIITDGITPFVIGGMQKHSYNLARQLAIQGHKVTLFHCVTGKNKLPEREELHSLFGEEAMKNLESICLRFPPPSWYPGHYLKESYIFSRMIYNRIESRLKEFDFIYAKGFTAWHFMEQKKRGVNMPPVGVKFHGYEMFQAPVGLRMRIENKLLSTPVRWNNLNADAVFSYGGKITSLIESIGVLRKKIIEIPTGIDPTWITDSDPAKATDKVHFCFIGRNERRKGIEELHKAIAMLPDMRFQFHFIGPIPTNTQLKLPSVKYYGALREANKIREILDQCQVLVTPSHSEGMPNVIMEAMARGLAILTTPVGAIESVVNQENGWLVEPGNVQQLADALQSITKSTPEEIQVKQKASLKRIAMFTWENIAKQTAEAIGKFCRGH